MNWRDAWEVLRGRRIVERRAVKIFLREKVDGGVKLSCVYDVPIHYALKMEGYGHFVEVPSPNPNAAWRVWVGR